MRSMEYISAAWRELLVHNKVAGFDPLWELDSHWFEAPNYRRGGWSGVYNTLLHQPQEGSLRVFVKRQENHIYRSLRHGLRAMSTFEREYRNILFFQAHGIPTVEWIYFGQRMVAGRLRAILLTRQLEGYQALDSGSLTEMFSRDERRQLMKNLAVALRLMHAHRIQHNCLYPKHILFKRLDDGQIDVRFIDLEKAKRRWFRRTAVLRDIATLYRHSMHISRTDKLRCFLAYRQEKTLSPASRTILAAVMQCRKVQVPTSVAPSLDAEPVNRFV